MVLFPMPDRAYWYVTDFWENFYAIPVTMQNGFAVWDLDDGIQEKYRPARRRLFKSKMKAAKAAAKMNRKMPP